jgi:hypothetical protein
VIRIGDPSPAAAVDRLQLLLNHKVRELKGELGLGTEVPNLNCAVALDVIRCLRTMEKRSLRGYWL